MKAAPACGEEPAEETPPNNRRGARQTALQALYWATSTGDDAREVVRELGIRSGHSPEVRSFSSSLVDAAIAHRDDLDLLIRNSGARWTLERMARIDLLILRLGLAEILHLGDVPVRVSIDEAVELARMFSTNDSYAFVNGVLDSIVRRQGLL